MMNLNTLKTDRSAYTSLLKIKTDRSAYTSLLQRDGSAYTRLLNSAIQELRGYPSDITLCAQDGKLEVNRLLLLINSSILKSAIPAWFPSSSILLPDFSIVSVRIFIELLSSGCSSYQDIQDVQDIPKEAFEDVFKIAKLLQIQLNSSNVQAIGSEGEKERAKNSNTSKIKDVDNASLQNDGLQHQLGEHSIYEVTCKEWRGEFHQNKFVSGTKGLCIFSRGIWMTPNEFEKFSGSTAKKYKQSLRVNGKPIENFLVQDGSRPARRQEANLKQQMNTARPLQVKGEAAQTNQVKGATNQRRKGKENNIPDKEYKKDPTNPLKVSFIPGTPLEGNIRDIGQCFTTDSATKDSTANANEFLTSNGVVKDRSATVEQNRILAEDTFKTKYFSRSNNITKENLKQDGEKSIFEVSCKESKAEFHHDKFISGGQGLCVLFKESWMTPNAFEKMAGSKAKKYKESLKVNGKPIKHLIDPQGNRPTTPSIIGKRNPQINTSQTHQLSNLVLSEQVQGDQDSQSANVNEDDVPQVSNPVKRKTIVRSNLIESASKIRKQDGNNLYEASKKNSVNPATGEGNMNEESMIDVSHFMDKKRKKEFNGGGSGRNINFKKRELDTMQQSYLKESNDLSLGASSKMAIDKDKLLNKTRDFADDDEIDLSGTPVFMDCTINANIDRSYSVNMDESYTQNATINESFVDLDESYTENALLIDLDNVDSYGSHVVKEKKSKKKNIDVSQNNDTKVDENYQEDVEKPTKSRFSADQTSGLREAFNENNFLSKEKAKILSQELCLTEKQVKDWFQNSRRSKKRTSTVPDKLEEKMVVQDEMDLQEYLHLEEDLVSVSAGAGFSGENQKYICELCTKSFVNKSKLVKHMSSHDSGSFHKDKSGIKFEKDGTSIEDEDQCRCECGALYNNPLLLNFHKNDDCLGTYK